MSLNPFAREYVPTVGKQTSLLNVSTVPVATTGTPLPASPQIAQPSNGVRAVGSCRCPTPAAEALEDEELHFEDVFEAGAGAPSPRSHLSPASPGGLSLVRTGNSCCGEYIVFMEGWWPLLPGVLRANLNKAVGLCCRCLHPRLLDQHQNLHSTQHCLHVIYLQTYLGK